MDKCEVPIFVHSLYRTGSTYIFSKFRSNPSLYCYLEPFHELLRLYNRSEFEEQFAGKTTELRHPDLSREYFAEFPLAGEKGVPLFQKRFSYDDFCLRENDEYSELKSYLESLMRFAPTRPSFHFCRSTLRARWLKKTFDSVNVYVLRSPRHQWESYITFDERYFNVVTMLIAGKHFRSPLFQPLHTWLYIPSFGHEDIQAEFSFYSYILAHYSLEEQYLVFYYVWLLSFLEALVVADVIIDIDLLSADRRLRRALESELAARGISVTFDDCCVKRYGSFTLAAQEMEHIEATVARVLRAELSAGFGNVKRSAARFTGFYSTEYESIVEAFSETDRLLLDEPGQRTANRRPADAVIARLWQSHGPRSNSALIADRASVDRAAANPGELTDDLNARCARLEAINVLYQSEIEALKRSESYRLGRYLLWPLRMMKSIWIGTKGDKQAG